MLCLLPLYALVAMAAAQGVGTPVHTIVLEALNSSTHMRIYRESVVHTKFGRDTSLKMIFSQAYRPGVRALLNDTHRMAQHMRTVLGDARKHIISALFEWTTVYVMATSDLRFMNVDEMEMLQQNLQYMLSTDRMMNPFQFEDSNVMLLTGEDEGALSFLSANYLLGAFSKIKSHNETVGVLDMGNTSTQITFVPEEPLYSEKYPLHFRNQMHEVYVQNYLQHGSENILVKIHNILTKKNKKVKNPINPCLLKDHTKKVELSDGSVVTHKGSGRPDMCEQILKEILKPNTGDECHPKPCAIGRVYQPRVLNVQFIATVEFALTPMALAVVDETKILHLERLRQAGYSYCTKTVANVIRDFEKDKENASQDCLMSLYTVALLHNGFGFRMDTTQIKLVPSHEGQPIDWAHGFVVQKREL